MLPMSLQLPWRSQVGLACRWLSLAGYAPKEGGDFMALTRPKDHGLGFFCQKSQLTRVPEDGTDGLFRGLKTAGVT